MDHPAFVGRSAMAVRRKLKQTLKQELIRIVANGAAADVVRRLAPTIPVASTGEHKLEASVTTGDRRIEDGAVVTPGVDWNDW
jgi:hypothetical protein